MSEPLRLGARVDAETGSRLDEDVTLPSDALTTHGVILGMTGSGKTGLGVVLLEEVLSRGIPVLALDPKGDLANLALLFPSLASEEFRPWVDEATARRAGVSVDALAEQTATRWKEGLASWGLAGSDVAALRNRTDMRVYTPGSSTGRSLDLIGAMAAPVGADPETLAEAAESIASSLLALAGVDADPLTSPEHILVSNVVLSAWRMGTAVSLETLIGGVQDPPFRKLGVFEVDRFIPSDERMKLAMRLNGLVASPTFAQWRQGDPLDMDTLLRGRDGRTACSIVQVAHLSDSERMFAVTLLLSRLVAWTRAQPGTSELRALLYIDEVFGFAPPTAAPASKKPLLTLFKQARAHGVGVVVSTQNPVDVDYKMMSNAGTWMVGRLQTERDKARVLEGLRTADGSVDVDAWDARLGQLDKRQFLLKRAKSSDALLFTTRWAMAFLRGPITRSELARLPGGVAGEGGERAEGGGAREGGEPGSGGEPGIGGRADGARVGGNGRTATTAAPTPVADDETTVPPTVADGVAVRFLDPATPWAEQVGVGPTDGRYAAGLAARVSLLFDEAKADLRQRQEWEAVCFPLAGRPDASDFVPVDHDPRDFREDVPGAARYVIPDAPIDTRTFFKEVGGDLAAHLHETLVTTLLHCPGLKLYSRPGEDHASFESRCMQAVESAADEKVAKLRDRFEKRLDTARDQVDRASRRVSELEVDSSTRRQQEMVAGAGDLIGMFLGGRRGTRALSSAASRRAQTRRTEERLRSAKERLDGEEADVEELEDELAEAVQEVWGEWRSRAEDVTEIEVGLEKGDIRVAELTLFWAPV